MCDISINPTPTANPFTPIRNLFHKRDYLRSISSISSDNTTLGKRRRKSNEKTQSGEKPSKSSREHAYEYRDAQFSSPPSSSPSHSLPQQTQSSSPIYQTPNPIPATPTPATPATPTLNAPPPTPCLNPTTTCIHAHTHRHHHHNRPSQPTRIRKSHTRRIALQNLDPAENAIVITSLDEPPFCCHEDLLTMSRPHLISVAQELNAKLPDCWMIDLEKDDMAMRREIEVLVGISQPAIGPGPTRDSVDLKNLPPAPKAVKSRKVGFHPYHTGRDKTPVHGTASQRSRIARIMDMDSDDLDRSIRLSMDTSTDMDMDVEPDTDANQTPHQFRTPIQSYPSLPQPLLSPPQHLLSSPGPLTSPLGKRAKREYGVLGMGIGVGYGTPMLERLQEDEEGEAHAEAESHAKEREEEEEAEERRPLKRRRRTSGDDLPSGLSGSFPESLKRKRALGGKGFSGSLSGSLRRLSGKFSFGKAVADAAVGAAPGADEDMDRDVQMDVDPETPQPRTQAEPQSESESHVETMETPTRYSSRFRRRPQGVAKTARLRPRNRNTGVPRPSSPKASSSSSSRGSPKMRSRPLARIPFLSPSRVYSLISTTSAPNTPTPTSKPLTTASAPSSVRLPSLASTSTSTLNSATTPQTPPGRFGMGADAAGSAFTPTHQRHSHRKTRSVEVPGSEKLPDRMRKLVLQARGIGQGMKKSSSEGVIWGTESGSPPGLTSSV